MQNAIEAKRRHVHILYTDQQKKKENTKTIWCVISQEFYLNLNVHPHFIDIINFKYRFRKKKMLILLCIVKLQPEYFQFVHTVGSSSHVVCKLLICISISFQYIHFWLTSHRSSFQMFQLMVSFVCPPARLLSQDGIR